MTILVVNDDSINSPGIALLAQAAAQLGKVWVVAPKHQCSAMSQRISIHASLLVEKVTFPVPVEAAYQVDGTPADCVKAALQYILPEKPDYVFSGINNGYNVGFDIAYSGTLGAAYEAVMNGIPAIAFSNDMDASLDIAETHLVPIARELTRRGQEKGTVWNVNFPGVPADAMKGIVWDRSVAPVQFYSEDYIAQPNPDGSVLLTGRGAPLTDRRRVRDGSDVAAVMDGYISIGVVRSAVM